MPVEREIVVFETNWESVRVAWFVFAWVTVGFIANVFADDGEMVVARDVGPTGDGVDYAVFWVDFIRFSDGPVGVGERRVSRDC